VRHLRRAAVLFACGLAAFPAGSATLAQEEEEETAEERAARIAEMLQAAASEGNEPSVLAGVDPRTASAAERRAIRTIRSKRVTISLEKQTVEDTLKILKEVTGLSFAMSAKARAAVREAGLEVSMDFEQLPVENVLNLMAIQLGDYRFTLRYGVVMLVKVEEYRPRKILRMYEVSDLVRKPRDFPAPRLGLGGKDDEPGS
jgi:hypothetical protein